jgi:hypothetical protein
VSGRSTSSGKTTIGDVNPKSLSIRACTPQGHKWVPSLIIVRVSELLTIYGSPECPANGLKVILPMKNALRRFPFTFASSNPGHTNLDNHLPPLLEGCTPNAQVQDKQKDYSEYVEHLTIKPPTAE